jgi:pimeloyl-ACP methyl ester carboxylesterase
MSEQLHVEQHSRRPSGEEARERLLAGLPVTDRRLELAGISTDRMGESWKPFAAYNLDRARTPSVQAALHTLMEQFGMPAIPPADLARISVPTTLIWGRHDLATQLQIAEAASAPYGWPLHVIENAGDDPPLNSPKRFCVLCVPCSKPKIAEEVAR